MSLLHLRVCALQILLSILGWPHAATPRPLQLGPLQSIAPRPRIRVGRVGIVLGRIRVAVLPDDLCSLVARGLVQLLLVLQVHLVHGCADLARLSALGLPSRVLAVLHARCAFVGRRSWLSTTRRLHKGLACTLHNLVEAGIRRSSAMQLWCGRSRCLCFCLRFSVLGSLQRGNRRHVLHPRVLSIRPRLEVCRRRAGACGAGRTVGAQVLEIALYNKINRELWTSTDG